MYSKNFHYKERHVDARKAVYLGRNIVNLSYIYCSFGKAASLKH
jgi:hypothetical protein